MTPHPLESALRHAEAKAERAMRDATLLIDSQEAWDRWQQAESLASEARRRWLAAQAERKAA